MKRILSLIIVLFSVVMGVAPGMSPDNPNKEENEQEKIEKILNAIQMNNTDDLKKIFSKKALEETKTFIDDFNWLHDFLPQAQFTIENVALFESGSFNKWKKRLEYNISCDILILDVTYRLYMVDVIEDTFDDANIGMKALQIINEQDDQKYIIKYQDMQPGIFNPNSY